MHRSLPAKSLGRIFGSSFRYALFKSLSRSSGRIFFLLKVFIGDPIEDACVIEFVVCSEILRIGSCIGSKIVLNE